MISSDPLTRRCKSSERTEGTMRSLSPLAIRVGWVSFDRSWGVPRPHFLIAFNCPERLDLDRRIAVDRAFLEPLDERLRCGLTGGVAVEEQELLRIGAGQGRSQHVPVGDAGDLVDVLAALGSGTGEDELADELGVLDD